jgi:predicted ATP-dependent Lon-type protease
MSSNFCWVNTVLPTIEAGLDQVRRILAKHFVHRSESELVKSTIKEKGRHKIIDKITLKLNDKGDVFKPWAAERSTYFRLRTDKQSDVATPTFLFYMTFIV